MRPFVASAEALNAQQDKDLIVITVIGVDRPGIVAGIASVLASHNVNIEDISQTVLRGSSP